MRRNLQTEPPLAPVVTYAPPRSSAFNFSPYIFNAFALTLLALFAFWGLQKLHVPVGHFVDWIVGVVTFWWLIAIVTVPWNIYFDAAGVGAAVEESRQRLIPVEQAHMEYVRKLQTWSLVGALFLHIASAAALFALSYLNLTPVGYIGSAAALLLTVLRPAVRGYEHLYNKLQTIKNRMYFPREDVVELRNTVKQLKEQVIALEMQLSPIDPTSFAANSKRQREDFEQRLKALTETQNKMLDENVREHERIARESKNAIAKISSDSEFLDHVREIVQMIKSA